MTFEDAPRCGRPIVVNDHDLCQALEDDNNITSRELGAQFKVYPTTILHALKRINLTYKFNHWVLMN